MLWTLLAAALFVAFANGANDNFKGVATLYGSGTLSYRKALALATLSVAAGGVLSVILASGLARAFSAKGLVPDAQLTPVFMASVASGAALTVALATWMGLPVSTTHSLVGGLVGAGFVSAGSALNLSALGGAFLLPLLLGPLLAVPLAAAACLLGRWSRRAAGIQADTCVCVGEEWVPARRLAGNGPARELQALAAVGVMTLGVGTGARCQRRYLGRMVGISAQGAVTAAHVTSAGLVGFARGLNDTPKILGLLLGAAVITPVEGTALITLAMALGGILAARRVARTLSRKVTEIRPGQGLAGNAATSFLVLAASRLGLPVSTTHVSTGSIFGIGGAAGRLRWGTVGAILLAWVVTLPLAALVSAAAMGALS